MGHRGRARADGGRRRRPRTTEPASGRSLAAERASTMRGVDITRGTTRSTRSEPGEREAAGRRQRGTRPATRRPTTPFARPSGARRQHLRQRRSSFGDAGSRSFGGRSRGGAGKKEPRREWGIQLDAEVEEPRPPECAPADDRIPPATARRPPARGAGSRPAGRGRAGSFGRPRRAEGEPAPEYEDPEQTAKQICLTALTGASRSRKQLADLLAARDIPDDVAGAVLDRFGEVGLVDDAAFAAAWVSSRQIGPRVEPARAVPRAPDQGGRPRGRLGGAGGGRPAGRVGHRPRPGGPEGARHATPGHRDGDPPADRHARPQGLRHGPGGLGGAGGAGGRRQGRGRCGGGRRHGPRDGRGRARRPTRAVVGAPARRGRGHRGR